MKVRVLSDLHLESEAFDYRDRGEDVVVLAGDIAEWIPMAMHHREALFHAMRRKRVLYVLGNHEFHHRTESMDDIVASIRAGLPAHVTLLHREAVEIGGVRFLGTPLWTDFRLGDEVQRHGHSLGRERAMHAAALSIPDFVYMADARGEWIGPEGMAALHEMDRTWLSNQIGIAGRDGVPVVVVTHWLPSPESVALQHQGSILTPYFASDCRDLMRPPVRLWCHGHTHVPRGYRHPGTETWIACNPRGTGPLGAQVERGFDPGLVVEVSAKPSKRRRKET